MSSGGVQIPPMSSGGTSGRIQSPPGLPLTDPPRVTGAYGFQLMILFLVLLQEAVLSIIRFQHRHLHLQRMQE